MHRTGHCWNELKELPAAVVCGVEIIQHLRLQPGNLGPELRRIRAGIALAGRTYQRNHDLRLAVGAERIEDVGTSLRGICRGQGVASEEEKDEGRRGAALLLDP